jgi:periplasmic divalent cation tolerance protein
MSQTAAGYRVVLSTAGSESQAREIARTLVERRLAACVNVVPAITSVYRWKGKVVEDSEALLIIKSSAARFEELRAAIRELHTYETPEVIALALSDGDPDYCAWIDENL